MRSRALLLALVLPALPGLAPAQADDPARLDRLRRVQEMFAAEPSWRETEEAALRHFRVQPAAIEQVRERLRQQGGAPVLVTSGWYGHGEGRRDLTIHPGPSRDLDEVVRTDHPRATVMMGFDLPETIFTPAELQTYTLTDIQLQVIRMCNMWYFYRRHFGLRLHVDPPADPRARTTLEIRIRGFTALLDVATGGWFSTQLPEGAL